MKRENDIAIIVPGGPRGSEDRLRPALKSYRELKEKGYNPHIIITGVRQYNVMYEYLKNEGVEDNHIIIDEKATSTEENVTHSMEICEERGWKKILFVPSYYQCKRLVDKIKEHIPNDWKVGWDYEEPNFLDIKYDGFLFLRYLHEFGATITDALVKDKKKDRGVKSAVDALLRFEGEIFSRLRAA